MIELVNLNQDFVKSLERLNSVIRENPDLPIIIMSGIDGDKVVHEDFEFKAVTKIVDIQVSEILDYEQKFYEDKVYCSREEFSLDVEYKLYHLRETFISEDTWNKYILSVIAEYDEYWKPCILVYIK